MHLLWWPIGDHPERPGACKIEYNSTSEKERLTWLETSRFWKQVSTSLSTFKYDIYDERGTLLLCGLKEQLSSNLRRRRDCNIPVGKYGQKDLYKSYFGCPLRPHQRARWLLPIRSTMNPSFLTKKMRHFAAPMRLP